MTENQVIQKILTMLRNDTQFVDKLSVMDGGVPMLIYSPVTLNEWSTNDKTANIYVAGATRELEYDHSSLVLACRAKTYTESRAIAYAAHEALNRYVDSEFNVTTTVLPTLRPSDIELDNFNTPVDILVKSI